MSDGIYLRQTVGETKSTSIEFRLTPSQADAVAKAANIAGEPVSRWCRGVVVAAATRLGRRQVAAASEALALVGGDR
jgi:uncharacterized protein (DUF1778 family)